MIMLSVTTNIKLAKSLEITRNPMQLCKVMPLRIFMDKQVIGYLLRFLNLLYFRSDGLHMRRR
jgi:hypothetical protein